MSNNKLNNIPPTKNTHETRTDKINALLNIGIETDNMANPIANAKNKEPIKIL